MAKKAYVNDGTNWVELASSNTDLSGYLLESSASTTYATKTELNNIDLSSASAAAVAAIVDSAPSTLNTLNELAAALGDDSNYASTITTALGNKLDIFTASSTYLTQASASTTYATKEYAENVSNQSGLVLITTSTQAASATNFLDGIFSSNYRNYKIIGEFTGTGGGGAPVAAYFKFKNGATYSNSHYGTNVHGVYNTTTVSSINTSNAAVFHFAYTNTLVTHFEMDVYGPFINDSYKSITGKYNSVGQGIQGSFGGHAGTTSSYTGFELSLGTGNIFGKYVVYGYNDGF
jgi:hypothetical protein